MSYTISKRDFAKYKEIRRTFKRKIHIFGKYIFVITDAENDAKVFVGKYLYDFPAYGIGAELTVGYCGHKLVNIRPGIVYNE